MGLFTQRPEEPSEWAGLPAEPLRPQSDAEVLGESGDQLLSMPDLYADGATTTTFVVVPATPPETVDAPADGDG